MDEDIEDILNFYHYGIFVPMERLRFSLGYLFYSMIKFTVGYICDLPGVLASRYTAKLSAPGMA